jgi:outer membrane autotransporter protein
MSDASVQPDVVESRLPETMSAFVAAGYLDGESRPMQTAMPFAGNDQFDGFYVAGGIESELGDTGAVGVALSYSDLEGSTAIGGQTADGQLFQATVYGKQEMGRLILDGQLSAGLLETGTERPGNLPGQSFTLRSDASSLALAGEIGLGAMFGERLRFGPRAALRASHLSFGRISETGGPTALSIDRDDHDSFQGRAGVVIDGVGRVRPNVSATYVHEFKDRSPFFGANFVGGIGPNVLFDTAGQDEDWFEVSGGLTITTGQIELSVSADTTLDREDVENQSYRAAVKFRF